MTDRCKGARARWSRRSVSSVVVDVVTSTTSSRRGRRDVDDFVVQVGSRRRSSVSNTVRKSCCNVSSVARPATFVLFPGRCSSLMASSYCRLSDRPQVRRIPRLLLHLHPHPHLSTSTLLCFVSFPSLVPLLRCSSLSSSKEEAPSSKAEEVPRY